MSVELAKAKIVTGTVSLAKGAPPVRIVGEKVTAECSWAAKKDYDVWLLLVLRNGSTVPVATFTADRGRVPSRLSYKNAVVHQGDVNAIGSADAGGFFSRLLAFFGFSKASLSTETLEINTAACVAAGVVGAVVVVYSAINSGAGSFRRYGVSMKVESEGATVLIPASQTNADDGVYSCVPAVIYINPDGSTTIVPQELYSGRGSERRPEARLESDGSITVLMDRGPASDRKRN